MQPMIVLSTVFALLVSYLEWFAPATPGHQPALGAAVIRNEVTVAAIDPQPQPQIPAPLATRKAVPKPALQKPLNLELPVSMEAGQHTLASEKSSLLDLFGERNRDRVTYNAELVFDRESGEDVTGGKVNIRIPLS